MGQFHGQFGDNFEVKFEVNFGENFEINLGGNFMVNFFDNFMVLFCDNFSGNLQAVRLLFEMNQTKVLSIFSLIKSSKNIL